MWVKSLFGDHADNLSLLFLNRVVVSDTLSTIDNVLFSQTLFLSLVSEYLVLCFRLRQKCGSERLKRSVCLSFGGFLFEVHTRPSLIQPLVVSPFSL